MHLLDATTYSLREFTTSKPPEYAILSHRWSEHELAYSDVHSGEFRQGPGLEKLEGLAEQARQDRLSHVWMDTCCINKDSSAELSEAINSMYQWYKNAKFCYVYLHDVRKSDFKETFRKSTWFTRGWTLQELLAPRVGLFFDHGWRRLGTRQDLACEISKITGIDIEALRTKDLRDYSVAQKMSWAARRVTSRPEDRAYCLIGLFDVNMPLLCGEGEKAFIRLQEEIIKDSDDQSIFAWSMSQDTEVSGLLAPRPSSFEKCGEVRSHIDSEVGGRQPFAKTNRGLSVTLSITPWTADTYLAYLDCRRDVPNELTGIFLRRLRDDDQYARVNLNGESLRFFDKLHHYSIFRPRRERHLFVRNKIKKNDEQFCLEERVCGFRLSDELRRRNRESNPAGSRFSSDESTLSPGEWGCVKVLEVAFGGRALYKIALGFDFDHRPVCLLLNSRNLSELQRSDMNKRDNEYWSRIFSTGFHWDDAHPEFCVYNCAGYDGVLALRGHRLHGLEVLLSYYIRDEHKVITLDRETCASSSVWIFDIDGHVDSRGDLDNTRLQGIYSDREHFQRVYGLSMSDDDTYIGDQILEKTYHPGIETNNTGPKWVGVYARPDQIVPIDT